MASNLARLMVRRHLKSWVGRVPEADVIAMFEKTMKAHPDMKMKDVVARVDLALRHDEANDDGSIRTFVPDHVPAQLRCQFPPFHSGSCMTADGQHIPDRIRDRDHHVN